MRGQAEEAADDAVLLHQSEAAAYATVLAELAAGQPGPKLPAAGVSMTGNRPLEKRLQALMAGNPWRGKVGLPHGRVPGHVALVFVAGSSVLFGYADTIEGSRQRRPPQAHRGAARPIAAPGGCKCASASKRCIFCI